VTSRATTKPFAFHPPPLPDIDLIDETISGFVTHQITGQVAAVSGESIEIEGMTAPIGAICEIESHRSQPKRCQVIGFHGVHPLLAPLDRLQSVAAGDRVRMIHTVMNIHAGDGLCGRVIDAFGRPLDDRELPRDLLVYNANRQPPESLDRPPIDQPLQTGVRAIDAMLTCGKGQRLGIFAGSGIGKSTLLGMLARGSSADRIVIGMVGERGREVQDFLKRSLGEKGFARSVVVVATSDRPASQRVAAAWTATAIAEAFRDQGQDVLLLLDSVTRFATAQRELGLAAGEPPTTRGYPPSVFNLLPRLVERAGRTKQGSITAFYTVLVEGDDNNEPIADSLRGLLDGHIVLSRSLASESHWPPIDILESLSRLQPHLVKPEMNQTVASARRLLADYRDNKDLISIGAYRRGSDPDVDLAIAVREPLNNFLRQSSDQLATLPQSQTQLAQLVNNAAASAELARANQSQNAQPQANQAPVGQQQGMQAQVNQAQANQTAPDQPPARAAAPAPNSTAR
jgi:flagellum-specific ATP synthase